MTKWLRLATPDLHKALPILAIMMEVIWSYAWLAWLSGLTYLNWGKTPLNFLSSAILALAVLALTRLAYARKWSIKNIRISVITGSVMLLLILIRLNVNGQYVLWSTGWFDFASDNPAPIVVGFFFGLYILWRSLVVSRQRYTFGEIYRKFIVGLVLTILLLIIWAMSESKGIRLWPTAGIYVISYFGVGILTLAISNLATLRSELARHQESTGSFSRRWISMLLPLILAILAISVALGSAFSSDFAAQLLNILGILGNWIVKGLYYVLLPLIYLIDWVVYFLRKLIALIRQEPIPPEEGGMGIPDWQKLTEGKPLLSLPDWLTLTLKWGGLALLIGLIIFFMARLLTKYWGRKNEDDIEEVHESLSSWTLVKSDLWAFLKWLFRWTRRAKKETPKLDIPPAPITAGAQLTERLFDIRELYQALLWQGRQMGITRRKAETPYEYSEKFTSYKSGLKEEVDTITEAYVVHRYNLTDPSPEKITLLNRIWRDLITKLNHDTDVGESGHN